MLKAIIFPASSALNSSAKMLSTTGSSITIDPAADGLYTLKVLALDDAGLRVPAWFRPRRAAIGQVCEGDYLGIIGFDGGS